MHTTTEASALDGKDVNMAIRLLTLAGGHQAIFKRVSDLQRDYASVIGELTKGHTVVIQRNDELVAVMVEPSTYNQLLRDATRTAELEKEVEHWKAMSDLKNAGGPSLADVRREASAGRKSSLAEARQRLKGGKTVNAENRDQ